MNEQEIREFYLENLLIISAGMIVFCIVMTILYFVLITPPIDPHVLNDCTREIVGNCIVK